MKTVLISTAIALLAGPAFAAGTIVKHVVFNTTKNAYTVEFENSTTQDFDAKTMVLKLDTATQKPFLEKGMHMYYLNFPNFQVMNTIAADVAP